MKLIAQLLIIGICIGLYFTYISPTGNEVKLLALERDEYTNILAKSKELKDQRDLLLNDYNSISLENIDRLKKVVPERFDSVLFANEINSMATQSNLRIETFVLADNNNGEARTEESLVATLDPYKTNKVSFIVTGSYENFIRFLRAIEGNLRLIDVVGLHIQAPVDGPNSMRFSLDVETYSLK